jgi:DNA polymerase-3 subunit delta'
VGKKLFARALAQCLFCERFPETELEACGECSGCRMMQAGSHPDFLFVCRPEGKNVVPIELIVGDEDRRGREGLCHDISLRPMVGQRRFAVVDDADLMNAESANALLKTLEEPPPGSILVLIAANSDALLPTIRSRCQPVRFSALRQADVASLLVELEMAESAAEAESASRLCDGSISAAARLLDPQLRQLRETVYEGLSSEQYRGLEISDSVLAGLQEIGGDALAQRQLAVWVVRFTAEYFRAAMWELLAADGLVNETNAAGGAIEAARTFAARLPANDPESVEMVADLLERTVRTEDHLAAYTPVPICLESLFLDLGRVMRAGSAR